MNKHSLEWTTSCYLQELQGYGWIKNASANFISTVTVPALVQELYFRYGEQPCWKLTVEMFVSCIISFPLEGTHPRLIKLLGATTKPIGFYWLISGAVLIRNSTTVSFFNLNVWFPLLDSGGGWVGEKRHVELYLGCWGGVGSPPIPSRGLLQRLVQTKYSPLQKATVSCPSHNLRVNYGCVH